MAQAPNKRPRLDSGEAEDPPLAFFALGEQGEDDTLSEEEDEVEDVVDVGDAAQQRSQVVVYSRILVKT